MKREDSAEYKKTEIEVIMTDAQDPLFSPIKMNKCGRPRTSKNSVIPHPKSIISQTLYAERKKINVMKCLEQEAKVKEESSSFLVPKLEPKIESVSSLNHDIPLRKLDNGQSNSMPPLNKHVSALNIMQTVIKKEEIDVSESILEEQFYDNDAVDSFANCDDNSSLNNFVVGKTEKHSKKGKVKKRKHGTKKKLCHQNVTPKVICPKLPLKCTYEGCSYVSRFMSTLKLHIIKKHIGEKPVLCDLCPYKCYHKGELRKHLVTHSNESPYVCDYPGCNYSCKISSNLKKHKRIHTGERPYICEQCTFRSNFISSLKAHKRVHTNERPFCCECCGYRSNNASNLKKHFLQKHPNKPYRLLKLSSNN